MNSFIIFTVLFKGYSCTSSPCSSKSCLFGDKHNVFSRLPCSLVSFQQLRGLQITVLLCYPAATCLIRIYFRRYTNKHLRLLYCNNTASAAYYTTRFSLHSVITAGKCGLWRLYALENRLPWRSPACYR